MADAHDLTNDVSARKQWIAIQSAIINTLLVIVKLIVGIYSGSVSIISEAAHSLVDLMASVIAFIAVRKSDRPADNRHAYGHGKVENLSGAFEAFLVIVAALWIVYEAVIKIMEHHEPEFLEYGIGVMALSVIANIWITRKLYKVAKETGSSALEADALHHGADVWTSVGVLAGLFLMKVTGLYWLDPVIAIFVAVIIFKAGYTMTRDNLNELMDASLPAEEEESVIKIVEGHPEIQNVHRLRTRRSGARKLMDMHVVLSCGMHINEAHALLACIKEEIVDKHGPCDILIHIEPDKRDDVKQPEQDAKSSGM